MKKRGQVWVETVLYTLIGLALIGIVLAIVTPRINSEQERMLVEQSVESMAVFDSRIDETINKKTGNIRGITSFVIGEGKLIIDAENDNIIFLLENFKKPYSEVGSVIRFGGIDITTTEKNSKYDVTLRANYSGKVNVTYNGLDTKENFEKSSIPYAFSIENRGDADGDGITEINIEENSRLLRQ